MTEGFSLASPNQAPLREPGVFDGVVRKLQAGDISSLRPILETWIRYPDTKVVIDEEVGEVMQTMADSLEGRNPSQFLVAVTSEGIVGTMGLSPISHYMKPLARSDNPAELINAYVASNHRGTGVGRALIKGVEDIAREQGYLEIVLSSGPRYAQTAWGFYDKQYGPSISVVKDHYGPGFDARIWSKILN